ncbi:hypothetical protein [Paraburkholderia gardini]|uniref:hypothetical protein n=1 Tax=Paraburkholderia gardini TaxID=2823469 RepID=UPI001D204F37|nr:hypothetical protein [Paraburkholderia gardini]CAG4897055.1 hypothetical protein R69919_02285 [Paraburkholderia gardini]
MNNITRLKPLFRPGRLLITPEAQAKLQTSQIPVISVMLRHIAGDWGCVSDEDRRENDLSIKAGLRLISLYPLPDGARILVITEWNRSQTTIELLEEVVPGGISRPQPTARCCYPAWPAVTYRARIAA